MEVLAIIFVVLIWLLFGGIAWRIVEGESFRFRLTVWFIFGYIGTVSTLQVIINLSVYFGWNS